MNHLRARLRLIPPAIVLGVLLTLPGASTALGQEKPADPDLPLRYLEALYSLDLAAVEQLTAPDIVFQDETAAQLGSVSWRFEGRDAVLDFFRSSVEGIESTGFEVVRRFDTADYTVLDLVYWTKGDGKLLGAPGVPLHLRVPAVTVIRTKDGRVVEHQDFADYDSLLRQVEEQVAAAQRTTASPTQDPDTAPGEAEPSSEVDALADRYLSAVWALDYEGMARHLHADARYEDYTMEYFGSAAIDRRGRTSVVEFFREANAGSQTQEVVPSVRYRFRSGPNVILLIDVTVTVDGEAWNAPGKTLTGSGLTVTWLRIEGGLVTRHMDFADYDTAIRQFEEQGGQR